MTRAEIAVGTVVAGLLLALAGHTYSQHAEGTDRVRSYDTLKASAANEILDTKTIAVALYDAPTGGARRCAQPAEPVDLWRSHGGIEIHLGAACRAALMREELWLQVSLDDVPRRDRLRLVAGWLTDGVGDQPPWVAP